MKSFFILSCVLIVLLLTLTKSQPVNVTIDKKEGELRAEYCSFPKYSPFRRECALFKCSKDRTRVLTIPCPYSPCQTKLSYTEEEFSKPYPDCCVTEC